VNWSAPRLQRVSPDRPGNTWAPEAVYDADLGQYVVFWASKLYSTSDPNHNRQQLPPDDVRHDVGLPHVQSRAGVVDKGFSAIDSPITHPAQTTHLGIQPEPYLGGSLNGYTPAA
jgi:hypothetical protein